MFSVAAVNSNGAGVAVIVHLEAPSEVDRAPWEVGHRGAVNVVLFLIFGYLSDNIMRHSNILTKVSVYFFDIK